MKQNYFAHSASSFLAILLLMVFVAVNIVSLIFVNTAHADNENLYCGDAFTSVPTLEIDKTTLQNVAAGSVVGLSGSYNNTLDTPVYAVSVYAAVYRVGGDIPLDWLKLAESDALSAHTNLSFSEDWQVASDLAAGEYELRLFTDVGQNLIYSRMLSKASSDYLTTFNITSDVEDTTLIQDGAVSINGVVVTDTNSVVAIGDSTDKIKLEASLLNKTAAEEVTGEINIEVYEGVEPRPGKLVAHYVNETNLLNNFANIERVSFPATTNDYTIVIEHTTTDGKIEKMMLSLSKESSKARVRNIDPVVKFVTVSEDDAGTSVIACVVNTETKVEADLGNYEYEVAHNVVVYKKEDFDSEILEHPVAEVSGRIYVGSTKTDGVVKVELPKLGGENLIFFNVESSSMPISFTKIDYQCPDCQPVTTHKTSGTNNHKILYVIAFILALFVLPMFLMYAIAAATTKKKVSTESKFVDRDVDDNL